ncbi:hypothetical protein H5410_037343 [Solanum commersonii]|uniref:Uncharacterized protein n=1 Tax=Solanum commersonii TaxID=4109 RepID=A0A9J5Y875_SOLCO|nr:hypothetical protein H5410_037343 [Solanum commersonii]
MLIKARERKARDLDQVKCIKDEEGKVLVDESSIKQRWRRYFHKLLNEEGGGDIVLGELAHSERLRDFGYCRCFRIEEVIRAISRMSGEEAIDPDEIRGVLEEHGQAGLEWLAAFNVILKTTKMPDEWRWSTMVPLYKNKGDIRNQLLGYQIAKPYYEDLGESGGDEGEKRVSISRIALDSCRTVDESHSSYR